jgi:cation diffusion facilitator CzcD-associated flavoprotein CzcO
MTALSPSSAATSRGRADLDVIIVGAGFGGLALLKRLRDLGHRVRVLEAAADPGGTWYANRYPGARCDVESVQYSYQFSRELEQNWTWTERYAAQPEILNYIDHVVERFDLAKDISFATRVVSATYSEPEALWSVTTDAGVVLRARYLVLATGALSCANLPSIAGAERFAGEVFHTGSWPHQPVSFQGKRVAVVGTGSSAIQAIPEIAAEADHLFVLQRTAGYCVPARNRPLESPELEGIKAEYPSLREYWRSLPAAMGRTQLSRVKSESALSVGDEERDATFEAAWAEGGASFARCYSDLTTNRAASRLAAAFIGRKIEERVTDPRVAELLKPRQLFGTKRLCLETGYYETFNRDNVTLVDVNEAPITEITAQGVVAGGVLHEVDAIVFATGFDALTGSILKIDVTGRRDQILSEAWSAGPRNYLGLSVAGFPNLFYLAGPGSPAVLSNVVTAIEQQVDWVADCLEYMRAHDLQVIEAQRGAQDAWTEHVNEISHQTLFWEGNSWYLGANIPGKPRVFMPYVGFPSYVKRCEAVAAAGYDGFSLTPSSVAALAEP